MDRVSNIFSILPAFLLFGCGVALTVPSLMAAALAGIAPERVGIGTGVLNAARQVGVALFASLIASDPGHMVGAMRLSIWMSVATLLSALLATVHFMAKASPKD